MKKSWKQEEIEKLTELYPVVSWDALLAAFSGRTKVAISQKALNLGLQRNKDTDDSKIKEATEVIKLRYQVINYKKQLQLYQKQESKTDLIIKNCKESLSIFDKYSPLKAFTPKGKGTSQSMVILVSDAQLGTEVIADELGRDNMAYSTNEFRYRLRLYLKGILAIVMRTLQNNPINNCEVFILGDLIEGETIFRPQMTFIDTNVLNQFYIAQYEVSRFLATLAQVFPKVRATCIRGNHGRMGESYKTHNELINWEYVLYRNMEMILQKYENISFDIPLPWWRVVKVENRRFLLLHGEDIRKWLNFPWYGTDRMSKAYSEIMESIGEPYDDLVFGHHHIPTNHHTSKGEWFCNGSFVGVTKFVFKRIHAKLRPAQWILLVHPKYGITERHLLQLDNEDKEIRQQTEDEAYPINVPIGSAKFRDATPFKINV